MSDFELKIPKFIGGQNKLNPIFDIIKSNYQLIITQIDGTRERFILKEQVVYSEISKGSKIFRAYALQKKLEDIRMKLSEGNYQLYNDGKDTTNIYSGVLNEVENQSGWTIGNIDENAKRELLTVKEISQISNLSLSTSTISQSGDIIFDGTYKSINISTVDNTIGKEPLYLSITYSNVKTNDNTNFGTIYHDFEEPFHDNITNIQTYYYSEVGNRYSIKYIFTLKDGTKTTIIKPFINPVGKSITGTFVINYTTGRYIKENTILNIYFDTIDDSISKVLLQVSEVFNVAFEFNTIDKIINVHSLSSLGSITNEPSSQLGQFVLGQSKLGTNPYSKVDSANLMLSHNDIISVNKTDTDSEIISGLKVIGKDDLSIVNINPNGTDIIENWDYFINNGNLTTSCINALDLYKTTLKARQSNWNTIMQSYLDMSNTLVTYSSQVKSYQEQVVGLQSILSGYRAVGDTANATRIQTQLTDMQTKLNSATNSQTILTDNLKELEETMAEYSDGNKKENIVDSNGSKIFSYSDLQVLYDLVNVETINDDYFSDELTLYEHYVQVMAEKVKPKIQFTTKTGNMYKYVYLNKNILKLGLWYELDDKLKKIFNEERIRLISYEYYPNKGKEGSFENLVYSNKVNSINILKRQKSNTSMISKTSQTVSKVATETSKLVNTINDKMGNGSLIDYKNNTAQELDTKLSSTEFGTKFNTAFKNLEILEVVDKGSLTYDIYAINDAVTTRAIQLPVEIDAYIRDYPTFEYSITCTESKFSNFTQSIIKTKHKLPYYRINKNYIMDEGINFNLVVQASMDDNCNGVVGNYLYVTFTIPDNYKHIHETFEIEWTIYSKRVG